MQKKKVFVGLSGGVDSSVSALLLKRAGYEVVGVYIKGWQPDWIECTWKEERLSALRTAAYLDIPFLTFDAEEIYRTQVADYMIQEYAVGRTPNGDMLCNREVKFGAFLKFALENGADYVATGHYAQNVDGRLLESNDKEKDQTYFLSQLTAHQLKHILFPISHLQKSEVREMAKVAGLPVATRKDSQGICFVGDMSMEDWLKKELNPKKGDILNQKGEIIGWHEGSVLYTVGQRHRLHFHNISKQEILYVISKDIERNIVVVGELKVGDTEKSSLKITSISFMNKQFEMGDTMVVRLRYRGEKIGCKILDLKEDCLEIELDKKVQVASGQFAVFYKGDECLGGGVIS